MTMKAIAVFYESETKANYFEEKKVLKRVCQAMTESEFHKLRNDYLDAKQYNKALSYCWYLPAPDADEIAKNWPLVDKVVNIARSDDPALDNIIKNISQVND